MMIKTKQIVLIIALICLSLFSSANENSKFNFIAKNSNNQSKTLHQIDLSLSSEVQDALNHGVEISIISRYASIKKMIFWHRYKKIKHIKFQLRRHALSNRYMVTHAQQQNPKVFRSVTEAMQYIGNFSLHTLETLQQESDRIALRIHLNKFDLPGSIRPKSFLSNDWTHNTGWKIWNKSI